MRAYIAVAAILMTAAIGSAQERDDAVQEMILRIEHNLREIAIPSVGQIFSAGRDAAAKGMSLPERIAHYTVPGVGIAVINDYKLDWAKGYGVIRNGGDAPVTAETPFEVGSTTKFLTAVLAMRLVQDGKLDLDEDVNLRLKSWRVSENEFTAQERITLRLLLSHRAGISRPEGGFDYEDGSAPTLVQVLDGEAPARNKPAVVEFVPGSQHQYSNLGYLIIQQLIEDVTGKPYDELAQDVVFEPLGMKHSTLKFPLAEEVERIAASPHDADGKAYDHWLHPTALAHGNLVTTPSDLSLLVIELMRARQGQSDRLLSQETVKQMLTSQMEFEPGQMFGFTGQGLGVFLLQDGDNTYFSHPGHNEPGTNCMFLTNPATGQGAIVMTNGAKGLFLAMEILAAVVNEYGW